MDQVKSLKEEIRLKFIEKRNQVTKTEREAWSVSVCDELKTLIGLHRPSVVHSFIPFGSEIDILPLLQNCLDANITLVIPKILKKPFMQQVQITNLHDLVVNRFGTKEPTSENIFRGRIDIVLVPGLAFSTDGFRIGYGGGYYDYFLANQKIPLKVGVGFPFQLVENLPHEDHDIPLDLLVLGDSVIEVAGT
ncbi:MAG: 5-formyltetrahydrofolate cyclo-ligase [Saprospiraceae bacterium]|nr:5-formyltetrahydrofolate cyclo-ligase [Saprospiraceae bacterium]